ALIQKPTGAARCRGADLLRPRIPLARAAQHRSRQLLFPDAAHLAFDQPPEQTLREPVTRGLNATIENAEQLEATDQKRRHVTGKPVKPKTADFTFRLRGDHRKDAVADQSVEPRAGD